MNEKLFEEIFEKIENKYGQEFIVDWYIDGWKKRNIKIKDEYFEILIPENVKGKSGILIKTFNSFYYYNEIESIVNAVNRLIKKSLGGKNE